MITNIIQKKTESPPHSLWVPRTAAEPAASQPNERRKALPVALDYAKEGKGLKAVNWEENPWAWAPDLQCSRAQRLGPATALAELWNPLPSTQSPLSLRPWLALPQRRPGGLGGTWGRLRNLLNASTSTTNWNDIYQRCAATTADRILRKTLF